MKLELHRRTLGENATIGDLYVDGVFECHTLEDVARDLGPDGSGKVWGKTAIPAGTYKVVISMSPKFGHLMIRLLDVPFFDGILMHKGNTDENTEGCILVARDIAGPDLVTHSTEAYDHFYPMVQEAFDRGNDIFITITNDFKEGA